MWFQIGLTRVVVKAAMFGLIIIMPAFGQGTYPVFTRQIDGAERQYLGGQVMVKFDRSYDSEQILVLMQDFEVLEVKKFLSGEWTLLSFKGQNTDPWDFLEGIKAINQAVVVLPNYLLQPADSPQDEFYRDLTDTTQSGSYPNQWGFFQVNMSDAWNITTGSSAIKLGVLDTGIDIDHPDFDFSSGRFSFLNLENPGNSVDDPNGHGTHMAGVITAKWNSGAGSMFAGMVKDNQIMIIKQTESGRWTVASFQDGVTEAVLAGVRVLNYSAGTPNPTPEELEGFGDGVEYADNNGLLVVASAGNRHDDEKDPYIDIPAGFQDQNSIICVAATEFNDRVAPQSSRNPNPNKYPTAKITLAAPGYKYWTTHNDGGYDYTGGTSTSSAAAMTTGLAGLILSLQSNLTDEDVRFVLEGTADKVGGYSYSTTDGWTKNLGHGRINARWALESLIPPYYDDCGNLWDDVARKTMEPHRLQGQDFSGYGTSPAQTVSRHSNEVIYRFFGLTGRDQEGNLVEYKLKVTYFDGQDIGLSLVERVQDIEVDGIVIDNDRNLPNTPQQFTFNIPSSTWYSDQKIDVKFKKVSGLNAIVSEIWILQGPPSLGKLVEVEPEPPPENPASHFTLKNYPNPFNPTTTVTYRVEKPGRVQLKVYNATGQELATLVDETKETGVYNFPFDASGLPSGVYFVRLRVGNEMVATQKMLSAK